MSARKSISLLASLVCLAMATTAWSVAAPSKLSYQAVLLNSGGQPVTTPVNVVFTIYDASAGGNAMWTETRNVTPDAQGRVNVMLGDNTPVADPVFSGPDRWLGIQVGVDPEMTPRTQFAASPYSRRVSTVDGSAGGTMDGNLTLRSTAAAEKDAGVAQPAQLTLISLNGDTIVVGPADQLVFRATNASGAELMSATISGPNGPVLGIADPGGNIAEHSGTSSSYYGNSTKDGNALQKRLEIGENGISIYDASGSLLTNVNPSTGGVTASGLNVSPPVAPANSKRAMLPCGVNAPSQAGEEYQGNLPVGNDNDLTGSAASFVVGSCNTIGIPGSLALLENAAAFGFDNEILSNQSFISGFKNFVDAGSSQITIFGSEDTVSTAGGTQSSIGSSILGGQKNFIIGPVNTIVSGNGNRITRDAGGTITCNNTTIAGGNLNRVSGSAFSFIAGGERNIIDIDSNGSVPFNHGVIGGGADNRVSNNGATIDGGFDNRATGMLSAIGGGNANEALGTQTTVGGGVSNTAGPQNGAVVAGGEGNTASGQWASVGGGIGNVSEGDRSHSGGGSGNITSGNMSVVAGGMENNITAGGDSSFIGGGYANTVSGKASAVVGGSLNNNNGLASTIGGGRQNFVAGDAYHVICGGSQNSIAAPAGTNGVAAIGGGYSNLIDGGYAATIPGGYDNSANGDYSFASGRRGKATNDGTFVWSDAADFDFPAPGEVNFTPTNNNFLVRASGGVVIVTGVDGSGNSTSGVVVPAGSGSWSTLSDVNAKENVISIDPSEVLKKVAQLDIASWNYKSQADDIRHIGPMAQDIFALFGYGESERHISNVDADGIALAAIQALHKKTQELESQKTEIDALRDQIAELKQLVESMSHQR